MMVSEVKKISFMKEEGRDFTTVLRERVSFFFKENQISTKANSSMVLKSFFYMSLVILNYSLILSNVAGGVGFFLLSIFFGFLISIGTMNIAHDALHGAYASNSPGNRMLGLLMDLFGASSFYWKKGHTIDHHTFTNIAEHDADLGVPFVLRLCPKAQHLWFHRFQHIYAPFLYCFNLMHWVYLSDFKRIYKIIRLKNKAPGNPSNLEIFLLVAFKCVHLFLFLALPIMVLPYAWWVVVLGYLSFLAAAGITLTVIFQLAHIVENVAFPLPDEEGKIENSFIKHQLSTTSNFAIDNRLVTFLFGGLNFQVEHHIFPHVCHMHLPKIAPIVRSTAQEFGLTYHANSSLFGAICSHFRTLKKLGQNP
jgi:linoleoyl-CoA desaturase